MENISLDTISTNEHFDFETIYDFGINFEDDNDISPYNIFNVDCQYTYPENLKSITEDLQPSMSYFHINCQGLVAHWDNFLDLLTKLNGPRFCFDFIGLTEIFRTDLCNLNIPGYHSLLTRNREHSGRVGLDYSSKNQLISRCATIYRFLFLMYTNRL